MEQNEIVEETPELETAEDSVEEQYVPRTMFNADEVKVMVKKVGESFSIIFITLPDGHKMRFEVDMDNWDSVEAMVDLQAFIIENDINETDEEKLDAEIQLQQLGLMSRYLKALFGESFFNESRRYFARKGRSLPQSYVMAVFEKLMKELNEDPKGR